MHAARFDHGAPVASWKLDGHPMVIHSQRSQRQRVIGWDLPPVRKIVVRRMSEGLTILGLYL